MKALVIRYPELVGLAVGMSDVVFRAIAALVFDPAEAKVFGGLLLGNVHHVNGQMAFGLNTMHWFGIAGAILVLYYFGIRLAEYIVRPGNIWFPISRGLIGLAAGVLVLNVLESVFTGKVTNYVGWVIGTRFTAINFGDVVLTLSLVGLPPVFCGAMAQYVATRLRAE
jgi:hypothetical protein